MGRLVMSLNVTVDGCCDHSHVVADDDLHRYALDMLLASNGVLLGRVTYELFETFWPLVASGAATGTEAELAFARELDRTPKHVVTHRLDSVGWANSSTVKGDLVGKVSGLKAAGDLVMFGSPGLAMALAQHGLIDEYHFLVQPMIAGRGPTLFRNIGSTPDLRLVEARSFRSGVVLHRYETPRVV